VSGLVQGTLAVAGQPRQAEGMGGLVGAVALALEVVGLANA